MTMNSVKIVEEFWERVWKSRNPAAIDNFVIDDFVITTGGVDVVSRTKACQRRLNVDPASGVCGVHSKAPK
jgi:hypothetical protein